MTYRFFHYTCAHAAPHIRRDRVLKPNIHADLPATAPIVWLTDLDSAGRIERFALGLTSFQIGCDRTEWQVIVELDDKPLWWPRWAKTAIPKPHRLALETSTGGLMPGTWYLALGAEVPIVDVRPNPGHEPWSR